MNTPSPEQIEQEGLYEHYQGSNLRWYVRLGTIGPVYEYQFEHEAINARICLNAAFQAGVAHVQAQAAPVQPDRTNWIYEDQLPEMSKEAYHEWYLKSDVIHGVRMGPPVSNREKERSGPSVEEVMEALSLAIKYIKESPCDPDIYDEQIKAWLALNDNPIAAELLSQER